jgi:hypothetical protein
VQALRRQEDAALAPRWRRRRPGPRRRTAAAVANRAALAAAHGAGRRGRAHLAECLKLQILELRNSPEAQAALAMCEQPLELMAKRDVKRLTTLCGCTKTPCAARWR